MKKKIFIILSCTLLVLSIAIINILNLFPEDIYATNILVEKAMLSKTVNETIFSNEYNVTILPRNYNQSIYYSSSNTNVATVDQKGTIFCNSTGFTLITISAKTNKDETICKTISITVKSENQIASLSSNKILFNIDNTFATNKLTYNNNPTIEVSTLNNIVTYDHTISIDNIKIKDEYKNKLFYDIVNIKLTYSNSYEENLSFEIFAIKNLNITDTNMITLEFLNIAKKKQYLYINTLINEIEFQNYEEYFYYNCEYNCIRIYPLKSFSNVITLKIFSEDFCYYIYINLNIN